MSLKLFLQYLREKLLYVDEVYAPELIEIIKAYSSPIVFLVGWIVWGIVLTWTSLNPNMKLILWLQYPLLIILCYLVWRDFLDWLDQKAVDAFIKECEEDY